MFLEADSRIRAAAIIGDRWHMDIVDVLEEPSELRRLIRAAGHNVLAALEARPRP